MIMDDNTILVYQIARDSGWFTYLLEDWDGLQQQKWWYVVVLNILNSNFGALATFLG